MVTPRLPVSSKEDIFLYRGMTTRGRTTPLRIVELGGRIRDERRRRRLSLEDLAARAGVSRSMLSDVERGGKAPTVLVLDRIATGLDTSIARLLGEERSSRVVVMRRGEQDVAHDPSGWERVILSPVLRGVEFELMRTTIPGGVDAGAFSPHAAGSREYLAMERGTLMLTLDGTPFALRAGDSVYYAGDCWHAFANPGHEPCVYYLAMELGHHRAARAIAEPFAVSPTRFAARTRPPARSRARRR
jgi:XRE family transcriptional regulator, regulator of sulfur utilization